MPVYSEFFRLESGYRTVRAHSKTSFNENPDDEEESPDHDEPIFNPGVSLPVW